MFTAWFHLSRGNCFPEKNGKRIHTSRGLFKDSWTFTWANANKIFWGGFRALSKALSSSCSVRYLRIMCQTLVSRNNILGCANVCCNRYFQELKCWCGSSGYLSWLWEKCMDVRGIFHDVRCWPQDTSVLFTLFTDNYLLRKNSLPIAHIWFSLPSWLYIFCLWHWLVDLLLYSKAC